MEKITTTVSITSTLRTGFIAQALLLFILGSISIGNSLQKQREARQISASNELMDQSSRLDNYIGSALFLGLEYIYSGSSDAGLKDKLITGTARTEEDINILVRNVDQYIGLPLGPIHNLKHAFDGLLSLQKHLLDGRRIQPEAWRRAITNLQYANEDVRLLITSPQNSTEFVLYQQLVVRRAIGRLYALTLEEALIIEQILQTNQLDDNVAQQSAYVREQAERQRMILNLVHGYLSVNIRYNKQHGFISLDALNGLENALAESERAFTSFDDIRRQIYAGTLLEGATTVSKAHWAQEKAAVLQHLQDIKDEAVRPLKEAIKTQQQHNHTMLLITTSGSILIVSMILWLFVMMRRRVLRPINSVTESMLMLAAGDTEKTLPDIERQDEVGRMIEALQVFRKNAVELKKHRDHLQEMVREQTADLIEAKEKAISAQKDAENANQMKSEFLANMSHELRTPVHAIINFARQGSERITSWNDERHKDNLDTIQQSGERLSLLLDDLLDLSKLEAGSMTFDIAITDIKSLTSGVVSGLQSLINKKNLTLNIAMDDIDELLIECDALRIHQVFTNLFSNAIKFTPQGHSITFGSKQVGDHIVFHIRDEGPGIPEDELETVFDKFIQSSLTKTGAGGTGLGLAICKEIVGLHHGSIWAENHEKGGACFYVSLPIIQPKQPNF